MIGADDDTAYVISRRNQVVLRILSLHANPYRDDSLHDVTVGSEPTAIAITPSGARVFVANWGEGTISVIYTPNFSATGAIPLNEALAATGALGNVTARPGLAHPRALAITDKGDGTDTGETLYATEFFSQPGPTAQPLNPTPVGPLPDASPPEASLADPVACGKGLALVASDAHPVSLCQLGLSVRERPKRDGELLGRSGLRRSRRLLPGEPLYGRSEGELYYRLLRVPDHLSRSGPQDSSDGVCGLFDVQRA